MAHNDWITTNTTTHSSSVIEKSVEEGRRRDREGRGRDGGREFHFDERRNTGIWLDGWSSRRTEKMGDS